ncbi:uncharacterized protein SOCE26_076080 [Sorangium cellulosum]|uniref:Alpha-galactosidase n=1 Tax=Sorangium cellulosum TaxID=56 RepID=A0A2L0F3J4_SORCE|nr:glycoside hydrolase family 36 protein [Sorangium cellulosum]AUX46103.1 uncharacterized protein SOCE26_076080 [Sorangium cellulosum]
MLLPGSPWLRCGPALAAVALSAFGCSDGGGPELQEVCEPGPFALGGLCLRELSIRVRSDGAWRPAGPDETVEVVNTKDMLRLEVSSTRGPIEAFALRGVSDGEHMLQQGYQSWSFAGALRVPAAIPVDDGGAPIFQAPESGYLQDEVAGISYDSAVLRGPQGGYLVMGALSAERATTGIGMKRTEAGVQIDIVYGALREPLPADAEGVIRSEPLVIFGARSANEGLARLAEEMKAALPEGTPEPQRPPGGWFSWNEHFTAIDEALVVDHLELAERELLPRGLPLIEIDDGWERAWGDWEANERFPGGMAALGEAITSKGLVAGIWMAPFLVELESETARTIDPSLLVRGEDGKPLIHVQPGTMRSFHVLDGTNPASMEHVTAVVKELATAGYRFFKLDFLYAGALPGARDKPGATGNEALRSGLSMLREAAGPGAIINACGAPILPVIGLADSLRIGQDTVFQGLPLSWPLVTYAARNTAARAFLAPLVWPDADQTQVRAPYTEDEARASAMAAALAGPAYSLGDDLTALDPGRLALALDPVVLDIAQGPAPALAEDLFASPALAPAAHPYVIVYLSNPGTSAPPPPVLSAVGQSGKHYSILFSWNPPRGVTVIEE